MTIDPLLPWPVIAGIGAAAAVTLALRARRGAPVGALVHAALLLALAVLAAVDPALPRGNSEARSSAADVLFVVDTTASMGAQDYGDGTPRIDGVRADIRELADAFPGAHFSLIRFDAHAGVEVPWTTDASAIDTAVAVLRPERATFSRGSTSIRPLDIIAEQVPRRTGAGGSRYSVVFYFADGEQRQSDGNAPLTPNERTAELLGEPLETEPELTSFAELADRVDAGAVLGYGTTEGAQMLEYRGPATQAGGAIVQAEQFVIDHTTEQPAISRADPEQLALIADELGIPFVHRTEPGGLAALAREITDRAPTTAAGDREAPLRLYWIPAIALVAVALSQWFVSTREATDAIRTMSPRRRRPTDEPEDEQWPDTASAASVPRSERVGDRSASGGRRRAGLRGRGTPWRAA